MFAVVSQGLTPPLQVLAMVSGINPLMPERYFCTSIYNFSFLSYKQLTLTFLTH